MVHKAQDSSPLPPSPPARSDPASNGPEFTREPVIQINLCLQPPLLASDQLGTKIFCMNSFMTYDIPL